MSVSYRDLEIWQKAIDLADGVYKSTNSFPKSEQFGITSQMRDAVVSVSSNIAEGWGRGTNGYLAQFVRIARGSLYETASLIEVSTRLRYLEPTERDRLIGKIDILGRMMFGFLKSLDKLGVREAIAEYHFEIENEPA